MGFDEPFEIGFGLKVTPKIRNQAVGRLLELQKLRLDSDSEVRSLRALRNHELDNQTAKSAPLSEIGTLCWVNETDPILTSKNPKQYRYHYPAAKNEPNG